jgi:hypothetical protein
MLKLIGLIATFVAGFGLGRARFRVHVRVAILTATLAAVAQVGLELALPHDLIEQTAESHLDTAMGQIMLMALAIIESAGLLFPVALMPWARLSSRAWATLYVLGAAVLAGATFYFPFDAVVMNGEVIGPTHAPYELGPVLSLPFGAAGYLVGWLTRRGGARSSATAGQF